jgi:hypothetical protein
MGKVRMPLELTVLLLNMIVYEYFSLKNDLISKVKICTV